MCGAECHRGGQPDHTAAPPGGPEPVHTVKWRSQLPPGGWLGGNVEGGEGVAARGRWEAIRVGGDEGVVRGAWWW